MTRRIGAPTDRRRLLPWSVLPAMVVLAVAAKLISMFVLVDHGLDAYRAGRYVQAQGDFAHLGFVDLAQPWVSPFDRGDALYRAKQYPAARAEFGRALAAAPSDQVCTVRHNLTLAGERIGDAAVFAKDLGAARTAYERALHDAGTCASTAGQRARLRALLASIHGGSSTPSKGGKQGSSSPPSDSQQQLQQRNQQALKQQVNTQQGDEEANGGRTRTNPTGKDW